MDRPTASPDVPARRPPAFPALRYRDYRLYFFGQAVSLTGTWLQMVAQGWLVWRVTGSALAVGLVTAAGSLPMLIFSLPGGTVADRVDRRRLILGTQTASMLLAALLGFLALQPGLQLWQIALVAAAMGLVNAFDLPARQAFVVSMVEREALMSAIALNSVVFNAARVLGPAVASALIAIPGVGVSGCFFLNAASYVAALFAIGAIRSREAPRADSEEPAMQAALAGLRYVRGEPVLLRLITLLAVVGVFGWSVSVLTPQMADQVLKGNAGTYGLLMAANGLGAVLGSLCLALLGETPHRRELVYGGLAGTCAGLAGFALSRWLPLSLLSLALAGAGTIIFSATGNTVVQSMAPDALRGRVLGVWNLVFSGSTPVGSLQAGLLARLLGAPGAILVGVAAMAFSGALVWRASERARRAGEPPARVRAPGT